jgi:O-antigen ligase
MIRATLLWMVVAFLALYAWRDWYKALCGLIVLVVLVEHPDFPKSIMGVQGLNPWNLLLFSVVMAWASARIQEGHEWDLPQRVRRLLLIYVFFIIVAFLRMVTDIEPLQELAFLLRTDIPTIKSLFSENIINCLKWMVPALLLFDGCRSEERFKFGIYAVLAMYVLLAVEVVKWMPISALMDGDDLAVRAHKIIPREIGFHRVNAAMLLAGGSWAIFSARLLPSVAVVRLMMIGLAGIAAFGMALTGGRMGMATWGIIAIVFGALKWRKLLLLAPIGIALIVVFIPGVQERITRGFSEDTMDTNVALEGTGYDETEGPHLYTVTAGRSFAWPFVFEKIGEAPLFGYGRHSMKRTGTTMMLLTQYGESFPHPHNAYLEWLLDNGVVGLIPLLLFYRYAIKVSIGLFRDREDKSLVVVGGVALSLILALLVAAMGSQSFYPREGSVGMLCAVGLALRAYVQKQKQTELLKNREDGEDAVGLWPSAPEKPPKWRTRYG